MSHKHNCSKKRAVKNIKVAFFLNLFFTVIEFIGGFLTNSIAIMSDALHDLGDSFSLGMAWFLQKYSYKKKTVLFSYGYKRLSLLGAFLNAVILLVGSLYILTKAIPRLIHPEVSDTQGMLWLAVLGVIVNGYAVYKTTNGKTMNEKVISLHLLEDVLSWVAVLIVSLVMMVTDLTILDPILSILITLYILRGVVKNLKQTVLLFLQTVPKNINVGEIEKKLERLEEVIGVHDIHIWSLDGEQNIMSVHIVVGENSSATEVIVIKNKIRHQLKEMKIQHVTIEIEFENEQCQDFCLQQG